MKKCLLDTNIISDILKRKLILSNEIKLDLENNYKVYIPLLTLVELNNVPDLIEQLIKYSQEFEIRILAPSFMIFQNEAERKVARDR